MRRKSKIKKTLMNLQDFLSEAMFGAVPHVRVIRMPAPFSVFGGGPINTEDFQEIEENNLFGKEEPQPKRTGPIIEEIDDEPEIKVEEKETKQSKNTPSSSKNSKSIERLKMREWNSRLPQLYGAPLSTVHEHFSQIYLE